MIETGDREERELRVEPRPGGAWRRAVRPVATLTVLIVGGIYVYVHRRDFALLADFDPRWAIPLLAAPSAGYWINGRILRALVDRFGVLLRSIEWFGLTVLHAFGNYAPVPQAGTIARGVYLKRVHALPFRAFLSVVAVTYVAFLVVLGTVGAIAGAFLLATRRDVPWPLWALVAVTLPLATTFVRGFWTLPLARRLEGYVGFGEALLHGRTLMRVGVHQVGLILVHAGGLWMAFSSIGILFSPWAALFLSLFTMGSGVLNVTPGNVGVAEGAAWFAARYVGLEPALGVVGYTLYRLATAGATFLLAPWFMSRLSDSMLRGERTGAPPRRALDVSEESG